MEWTVVSYGRPITVPPNMRVFALPSLNYAALGRLMSRRPWRPLNIVYYLPLTPLAWIASVATRPNVLIANGIMPALVLLPLKAKGARLVLVYHGFIGHFDSRMRSVLRRLLSKCDAALVNSQMSLDDLSGLIPSRKITVVPHPADSMFFTVPLSRPINEKLVVLFVGRLDAEKFAQCLRVCKELAAEGAIELWAVGRGKLETELKFIGCRRFGYIHDRKRLAAIYGQADIVWAPADATYLSLPGVEALASGCPLIVSDVPAVEARARVGIRIPTNLIPQEIGQVVNGMDDEEAIAFLRNLSTSGVTSETREACRRYASRHHRTENIEAVQRALFPEP